MFGHHDDNSQDQSMTMPMHTDDSTTASLPMPENEEAMMPMELNDSDMQVTTPQTFRRPITDDTGTAATTTSVTPGPVMTIDDAATDLIAIKQAALQNLKPLVGHLEQTPEEKFRTTMMMIQASDDQSLIPEAYEAAKRITDEKVRAQALLDVVNEINYFTSQHNQAA